MTELILENLVSDKILNQKNVNASFLTYVTGYYVCKRTVIPFSRIIYNCEDYFFKYIIYNSLCVPRFHVVNTVKFSIYNKKFQNYKSLFVNFNQ